MFRDNLYKNYTTPLIFGANIYKKDLQSTATLDFERALILMLKDNLYKDR